AEQIIPRLAAVAKRELARFLIAGIEMLVEPAARRAEDAALAPVDLDALIGVAGLIGPNPRFRRPHERVALRAQDEQNRAALMEVRLVIASHRPLGNVADQRAAAHVEGSNLHAVALGLRRIDQRAA